MANNHGLDATGFKSDVHRLSEGVGTLKADVSHLAHDAADAARSGVAELRQGAHHAVEVAKEKYEGAKDTALDAADSFKSVVANNPMASIGIAAGVGLLIGLVMCRRS